MYFTFVLLFRGIFPFSSEFLAILQGISSRDVNRKVIAPFLFFLKTLLTTRNEFKIHWFRPRVSKGKLLIDAYL